MADTHEKIFALPDLGEGLQEAEIVAWLVAEGDHVVADQPLVSVETDKAVVEIPSPQAGRIARLMAPLHAHVAVGAPLVTFAAEGAEQDTGTVVGTLAEPAKEPPPTPPPTPSGARVRAAPVVRALAAARGIDLATLTGTGPDGTISRADVESAVASPASTTSGEALHGTRRAMAQRMAAAGAAVVPATVTDEADIEAWPHGTDIMARLVQALVTACAAEPALNVAFDSQAMTRRANADVHIGIAMDTPDGLLVPVLRDAQTLSPTSIRAALARLKEGVATRAIKPAELRGATISLSNFGTLGGLFANLVVVPPQVAILGAGRITPRLLPRGESYASHRMLPLSLTFDHRVVRGGEAARFLAAVRPALAQAA